MKKIAVLGSTGSIGTQTLEIVRELKDIEITEGLLEIARMEETEILVTAIVGMLGIRPTIAAIEAGKTIALANKETLVTAGHIIMPLAKEKQVSILPVDSEHSAIFQSLHGERGNRIQKILLTASGGPFRGKKREEFWTSFTPHISRVYYKNGKPYSMTCGDVPVVF